MGKLLHRPNDVDHALNALSTLGDRFGNLDSDPRELIALNNLIHTSPARFPALWPGIRGQILLERVDHLEQPPRAVIQKLDVIADKLHRGVDLVGDAGGKLSDRLELLRLEKLCLELLALANFIVACRGFLLELLVSANDFAFDFVLRVFKLGLGKGHDPQVAHRDEAPPDQERIFKQHPACVLHHAPWRGDSDAKHRLRPEESA